MSPTTFLTSTTDIDPAAGEEQLGKRERNKLDKHRRIVAAATELFQQKGFDETTTAEIAAHADIGAGTLYLYVESKEDLLVSAFVNVAGGAWAEAFQQVDPLSPLLDQLMSVFDHVTDHHHGDQRLARAFFKELPYVSPTVRAGADEFNDWFAEELEALLESASVSGKLSPDVDRSTLTQNLYSLWQIPMRRLTTEMITREEMTEQLQASVRVALWHMTPET